MPRQAALLLALLATGCEAYATLAPRYCARGSVATPTLPALLRPATLPRAALVLAESAAAAEDSPRFPSRAWFKKWAKFDRATLQTLGVDFVFTYGIVSNMNVALTASLAWAAFSRATGLSPLAPGASKGYFAAYAAIYLSLGTVLRPVRMALAVSVTPLYTMAVAKVRDRLPFGESRPKLNRTLAIITISVLLNIVGLVTLTALGAWIASLVTGVPMFPPGYVIPFLGRAAATA